MATRPVGRSWQLPQRIAGYRIGWFAGSGLVFAEGRAREDGPCPARKVRDALSQLAAALAEHELSPPSLLEVRLRRLDIAVDISCRGSVHGISILEQAAAADNGKVAVYRDEHCVETVALLTPSGRTKARIYDKGRQMSSARRGRWLRFEAQWLFPSGSRPIPAELGPEELRERFASRFRTIWHASSRPLQSRADPLIRKLAGAIEDGELLPSRARSLVGYLFLAGSGLEQGARRTIAELDHECRELGLSPSFPEFEPDGLDLVSVFETCLRPELWR
jgi:hypothetical protein